LEKGEVASEPFDGCMAAAAPKATAMGVASEPFPRLYKDQVTFPIMLYGISICEQLALSKKIVTFFIFF
jgi:hypothetical protein